MNPDLVDRWLEFAQLVAGVLIFTAGAVQFAFSHPFRRDRNRALLALGVCGALYASDCSPAGTKFTCWFQRRSSSGATWTASSRT